MLLNDLYPSFKNDMFFGGAYLNYLNRQTEKALPLITPLSLAKYSSLLYSEKGHEASEIFYLYYFMGLKFKMT